KIPGLRSGIVSPDPLSLTEESECPAGPARLLQQAAQFSERRIAVPDLYFHRHKEGSAKPGGFARAGIHALQRGCHPCGKEIPRSEGVLTGNRRSERQADKRLPRWR